MSTVAQSATLRAMTTSVEITAVGTSPEVHREAIDDVAEELEHWEDRFSRFRPESMLSRLNGADGTWTPVDEVFLKVIEAARAGVFATGGRFDPAILSMLEAQGYTRTFGDLARAVVSLAPVEPGPTGIEAWWQVEIDLSGQRVRLPAGMRIDLGGIAKGALADRLADRYASWPGGMISIGGDLRLWGTPPSGNHWRVGIEDPEAPDTDLLTVDLIHPAWTGIATSSRTRRQWRTPDGIAHHLIDPRTGASVQTPLLAVTACAATAVEAEISTKSLMIASASREPAADGLASGIWAITITAGGHTRFIGKERA